MVSSFPYLPRSAVLTFHRFSTLAAFAPGVSVLTALAFLWWRLIDHLRLEWSVNAQYDYGWAVPFLCAYLAWQRWRQPNRPSSSTYQSATQQTTATFDVFRFTFYLSRITRRRSLAIVSFLLLAGLWLPIRLIQEANPEWRLVSWALTLEVIGFTALMAPLVPAPKQNRLTSDLMFPLCFMLVAVPWPNALEGPLVLALTRSTTALTSEALNLAGIPALQRGNLVEVGAGVVGIEEACSGIRSFQAALMLALFFGEHYRLKIPHRLWLVLGGWFFAFASNLARTTVLAATAARNGMVTIATWHNPVGLLGSLACFVALALLARAISKGRVSNSTKPTSLNRTHPPNQKSLCRCRLCLGFALLGWLLLADAATETWYRAHELRLPPPVTWSVAAPSEAAFEEKPLSEKVKRLLRFGIARDIAWSDSAGRKWQAIYLYWAPGRVAARLANDHTPAICLGAAGRSLLARTHKDLVNISGLPMRTDFYVATDPRFGKVHVLYCIREDRPLQGENVMPGSIWHQRLGPVLAGRRNCGQRSLELAVWGIEDEKEAKKELIEQMQQLIQIEPVVRTQPKS